MNTIDITQIAVQMAVTVCLFLVIVGVLDYLGGENNWKEK